MNFLNRYEMSYLQNWIKNSNRKPLVLRGARQVGKSTLVFEFAKIQNLNLIYINFEKRPQLAEVFLSNDVKEILETLSILLKTQIQVENSILFLDEIQQFPQIFSSLRYFFEDLPKLPVICAASVLELALFDNRFPIPVGRIAYLFMGPLTFLEFIEAKGHTTLVKSLKNYKLGDTLNPLVHEKCLELLKEYYIVGGMPEVVREYVKNNKFSESAEVKSNLLGTYIEDFRHNVENKKLGLMRTIFEKVPEILGEKFKFSNINKELKSGALKSALDILVWSKTVYQVMHTDSNGVPLGADKNEKYFKLYFIDVGLVFTALGLNETFIKKANDLTLVNSGKIAEQFIAQHLIYAQGSFKTPELYYWARENAKGSAEVDFVVSCGTNVIPVEVKSGKTGTLRSLHYFIEQKNASLAVRFNTQLPCLSNEKTPAVTGKSKDYQLLSLPLYLVEELNRLLNDILYPSA